MRMLGPDACKLLEHVQVHFFCSLEVLFWFWWFLPSSVLLSLPHAIRPSTLLSFQQHMGFLGFLQKYSGLINCSMCVDLKHLATRYVLWFPLSDFVEEKNLYCTKLSNFLNAEEIQNRKVISICHYSDCDTCIWNHIKVLEIWWLCCILWFGYRGCCWLWCAGQSRRRWEEDQAYRTSL